MSSSEPGGLLRFKVSREAWYHMAYIETGDWLGGGGGSTVEVTWSYRTTSTIESFATLSSVIFVMFGSIAKC